MEKNFVFISPNFPRTYYQFPREWKKMGGTSLCISSDSYYALPQELRDACSEYYQVGSLENYDEVYRAIAWFAHKHGRINWLESNNEYWLEQDAKLRKDFNITTGDMPETVMRFKTKSNMKKFYAEAGVPTARWHLNSTYEEDKAFVEKVGFPVVVKPDDGVGANATWKLNDEADFEAFEKRDLPTTYIMEEYVPGYIVSFDGLTDQEGHIIFKTSHTFPDPIMEIVNDQKECYYWSERVIPADLDAYGSAVIKAFGIKARFFHTEYFRLNEDKEGLGKKGSLVGLEVNMRPPGGFTPDMFDFANDINIYQIYANMCMGNKADYHTERPYYCCYVGRRDGLEYAYTKEQIAAKYGTAIRMQERTNPLIAEAMGDDLWIARFKTKDEVMEFIKFVLAKKEKSPKE